MGFLDSIGSILSPALTVGTQAAAANLQGEQKGREQAAKSLMDRIALMRQQKEDDLKNTLTNAQIGNYKSEAEHRAAQDAKGEQEAFGTPFSGVQNGQAGLFQHGSRGTIRPVDGVSPYESPKAPAAPRNIDPLSAEGIGAALRRQQGINALKVENAPAQKVPPAVQTKLAANKAVANQLDALLAMSDTPAGQNATGWKGYLPDAILQRTDKEGNAFRALLSDVGSRTIHERTGAAMGAAEWARLKGFVPTETDSHEQIRNKIVRMRQALADETTGMGMPYGVMSLEDIGGVSNIPEARRVGSPSARALPHQNY